MGFNARIRNGVFSSTPSLDAATSAALVGGTAVNMADVTPGTLSATCTLLAETNTITLAIVWEVSADGSTAWKRATSISNAAPTVYGTGTGGADTAVTRVNDAPSVVYGWPWCRASVLVGVATGTTSDTATIAYNYAATTFQ